MRLIEKLLRRTEVKLQNYLYDEEKSTCDFYSTFDTDEDFDYEINDKDIENFRNSINYFNVSFGFEIEYEYISDEEIVIILEEIKEHHKEDYLSGIRELEWYNKIINVTEYKIEELKSIIEHPQIWRIINLFSFCTYQIIVRFFRG